jgi:pimeloyl-ACP methyl ester carboxylesterase
VPPPGVSTAVHHSDRPVTVVLVHGAPDRGSTFRRLIDHLPQLRVVTYDRRGYGRSLGARPAAVMSDHANDLVEIVHEQPHPCVAVAHSFGSNPAMLAASLRPELFPVLGIFEPPLPWVDWWPQSTKDYNTGVAASADPEQVGEDIARALLGETAWNALDDAGRSLRRAEGRAFQTDMASELTAPFEFASISALTVVGYATESPADRRVGAPWLTEQLPNAKLYVIDGAGHFAHRTHPASFARFVETVVDLAAFQFRL